MSESQGGNDRLDASPQVCQVHHPPQGATSAQKKLAAAFRVVGNLHGTLSTAEVTKRPDGMVQIVVYASVYSGLVEVLNAVHPGVFEEIPDA